MTEQTAEHHRRIDGVGGPAVIGEKVRADAVGEAAGEPGGTAETVVVVPPLALGAGPAGVRR